MSQEHLKGNGNSSGVSSSHGVVGQRVSGLVEIQPNSECSQDFINKEKPPSYEEAVQNKYIGGPSVSTNVPYTSSQLNAVDVQPFSTSKPYETQANKYIGGPSVSTNVPYTSSQLEVQPLSTSKPYETQPNVVIHKHYYHQTEPRYSTNSEPTATSQALACLNCFNCFISCMEIVLLCVQCFKN